MLRRESMQAFAPIAGRKTRNEMKYRVLNDDEIIQDGDVRTGTFPANRETVYRTPFADIAVGMSRKNYHKLYPSILVERPVRKPKRLSLAKLLRRLPKGAIAVIYWDGAAKIETFTVTGVDDKHFATIVELRNYLLTLPESESEK